MSRPAKLLFVDQITLASLPRLLWDRTLTKIFYFQPPTPLAAQLLQRSHQFGLLSNAIEPLPGHIGEVRHPSGESEYIETLETIQQLCNQAKQNTLTERPWLKQLEQFWDLKKALRHWEMAAEQEIKTTCLMLKLTQWFVKTHFQAQEFPSILLRQHSPYLGYIQAYALAHNIELATYPQGWDWRIWLRLGWYTVQFWQDHPLRAFFRLQPGQPQPTPSPILSPPAQPCGTDITIGLAYGGCSLSFDDQKYSEFFWLEHAGLNDAKILLYDAPDLATLTPEAIAQLQARNIQLSSRRGGSSDWKPTGQHKEIQQKIEAKFVRDLWPYLWRGHWQAIQDFRRLRFLAYDYAYWYDFYLAHQIRINIALIFFNTVGQALALDTLQGVSLGYQYSISNLFSSASLLGRAGEPLHVQFVFSQLSQKLWQQIGAPVDTFVHTGYMADTPIHPDSLAWARALRQQLWAKGARLILCFFDESPLNCWDSYGSEREFTQDYVYLLEWLLADPTLGFIFKSKKTDRLFHWLRSIPSLIEAAKATQRCVFLTATGLDNRVKPGVAAKAADFCIGKLEGATAALEAHLAGTRTLLIDTEGFHRHRFYHWGAGRVVFPNWPSLRHALEQYRAQPEAQPNFGQWLEGLEELDPFRDGQAHVRMGAYIRWIYEALNQGVTQQEAIALASEQFAQCWGTEHISWNRPTPIEPIPHPPDEAAGSALHT